MTLQHSVLFIGLLSISVLASSCEKQEAKVYSLAKDASVSQAPPAPAGAMPAALPPNHPEMGGDPALEVNIGTPPPRWKAKPATTMRIASFEIDGDKGATADISLVLLSGAAGGILDNVNRWQSQLGQTDLLTAESLPQKTQRVDSALGEMTVVDLQGLAPGADAAKDGRIVAAIVTNGGASFFFKMRGNAELVEAQKADFIKWAGTVGIGADKTGAGVKPPACSGAAPVCPAVNGSAAAPACPTTNGSGAAPVCPAANGSANPSK